MAATDNLRLEIVTPKGVVLSEDVEEVIAPSVRGEFGVLPGRLPMLAALATGIVRFKKVSASQLTDVAVGSGFVEVNGPKTLVLTDRFMAKDAVEVLSVRARLKEVDQKLETWQGELDDPMRLELIEEEQWLAAQLELYGDPPGARGGAAPRAPQDYSQLMLVPPAPEPIGEDHHGEPMGIVEGHEAERE
jgi:F-type H+-transporting ATPase subunit epsilon